MNSVDTIFVLMFGQPLVREQAYYNILYTLSALYKYSRYRKKHPKSIK